MKYVKMLGLLAVAAAALMAFAGSASALVVTEAANDQIDVNDVIKATSTHSELTGTIPITCTHSFVEGKVTDAGGNHGGTTTPVKGNIEALTFGSNEECGNTTVKVVNKGTLELKDAAGSKGTLYSTGAEVTVLTHSFFLGTTHCIYKTNGTHLGEVSGDTLSIESAPIPEVPTPDFCGEDAEWDGTYTVTSPSGFNVD